MKAIVNLYIYSSLHIALCAVALVLSTFHLSGIPIDWNYTLFIGSGTMLIYSLHRIVGIRKVADSRVENRFKLIRKYRSHLIIYAILATIASLYSFYNFNWETRYLLIIPGAISLLYVLPIFLKNNRLRDYNYIKIFLVAIAWALLCGGVPLYANNYSGAELTMFIVEKALFIFAITLPFDFRDAKVDKASGVKTLAHLFGSNIKYATLASFVGCIALVLLSSMYSDSQKAILLISYLIIETITRYSMNHKHDYFYSGLIDGTMILFYLCTLLGNNVTEYIGL